MLSSPFRPSSELAIYVHGAKLGLIESRLIFLGDNQDLIGLGVRRAVWFESVEAARKFGFREVVQIGFSV